MHLRYFLIQDISSFQTAEDGYQITEQSRSCCAKPCDGSVPADIANNGIAQPQIEYYEEQVPVPANRGGMVLLKNKKRKKHQRAGCENHCGKSYR